MIKKIINVISTLFSILLIGIVLIFIGLNLMGIKPFIVLSGSMEPNIHTGSICFIDTNFQYENIEKNDVIAFKAANGVLVTHRVINISEDGMETKGDNNEVSDGISTTKENFEGKNLFSIPYLGYISQFIQTTKGKIICVTTFICLTLISFMFSNEKKENISKSENE